MTNQEFAKAAELKQQIIELEQQKDTLDSQENSFSQTVRSEEKVFNNFSLFYVICIELFLSFLFRACFVYYCNKARYVFF